MKENYTHIAILLDRSGSMASIKEDMEGGILEFLKEQKEIKGECTLSLATFDNVYEVQYHRKPISEVEDVVIYPRGMTALIDSMSLFIKDVGADLNSMPDEEKPDRVLFITITDGCENASREFTNETLKELISEQEDKYNWNFTYIGANQDAFSTARSFGGRMDNSMNYSATVDGIKSMSKKMSDATTRYRTADAMTLNSTSFSYTDEELNND